MDDPDGLFQCIPNLSEGRRLEVVEQAAAKLRAISGLRLLDYSADKDHNRSVFTFIGGARAVKQGVISLFEVADQHISLAEHQGKHPRIGAVDVVPFVPLEGTEMSSAVDLARVTAEAVVERFKVPVYFYEQSSSSVERQSLAYLRRGGFEALRDMDGLVGREPDLGPTAVHPRLGASCFGARFPLVAFNVLLNTSDVSIAKAIAAKVRERGGGLRFVRALGIFLEERQLAQVSMNLVSPEQSTLYSAFEMVRMEARRYGVTICSSELIGVVSLAVLAQAAAYYLQLEDFGPSRVLEQGILDYTKSQLSLCPGTSRGAHS